MATSVLAPTITAPVEKWPQSSVIYDYLLFSLWLRTCWFYQDNFRVKEGKEQNASTTVANSSKMHLVSYNNYA